MSNKKETPEEIIINKGEIVYKELEEREGHESTARDISKFIHYIGYARITQEGNIGLHHRPIL